MGTIIATVLVNQGEHSNTAFNIILWDELSEFKSEEQLRSEVKNIANICAWMQIPTDPQLN
jgi:hypothetical protein